jgi:hypothetical protein
MYSSPAFTSNNDLTYTIINNVVIAVSMEKFISLKHHLTDEYPFTCGWCYNTHKNNIYQN